MQLELGKALRDKALTRHAVTHKADIEAVRKEMVRGAREEMALRWEGVWLDPPEVYGLSGEVTADDASEAADRLGLPGGERRWLGAVFRNWPLVQLTDRVVMSKLARRNGRRIAVWRWV